MRFSVLIPFLLLLSACSAKQSDTPPDALPDGGPDYDPSRISVPFLVDDHFIPSGCMGDCQNSVSIDSDCPDRGAIDAQGECHHFVFSEGGAGAALGWAGVLWQTSEKNWGSLPGRKVDRGATTLQFYAAGVAGGERLEILVGGMDATDGGKSCSAGDGCASGVCEQGACTAPHHDTLGVQQSLTLTSAFKKYEISFGTHDYGSEVMSGFGWIATMPAGQTRIEFFIDDLRWE